MKISDLVLYVRIWLLMATLWFFAAAVERFTYPFRYEGELTAAEVPHPAGDCRGLSAKTMIAWRLTDDKKSVEYKCPASRPWPFYATSSSTEIPKAVLQVIADSKKDAAKVKNAASVSVAPAK
ncbi:MAG: hypothetical protein V4495_13465 [Pseudomonadota bacterium]